MESIPVETWQVIFGHACVDNGFTGRSLSGVCRYFREVSKAVRFQSLKLVEMHQLLAFRAILAVEPGARVRSLFIIDGPRPSGEDAQESGGEPILRLTAEEVQERDALISDILQTIAPTLEILFLDLRSSRTFLATPVHLPALRELSVYGTYNHVADVITPNLPPFSNLRRLHFSGSYDVLAQGTAVAPALADVNRLAPSLTHLACTNGNIILIQQIASALGLTEFFPAMSDKDAIPRTLTHILFNPGKMSSMLYRQSRSIRSLLARDGPSFEASKASDEELRNWLAACREEERFWASSINIVLCKRNSPRLSRSDSILHLVV